MTPIGRQSLRAQLAPSRTPRLIDRAKPVALTLRLRPCEVWTSLDACRSMHPDADESFSGNRADQQGG